MDICVLFITGLNKAMETWNVTEKGKEINIQKQIAKSYPTLSLAIDEATILRFPDFLNSLPKQRYVVVTHSLGVAFGLAMADQFDILGFVLIDPTPLNERYFSDHGRITIKEHLHYKPNSKHIFHIHLNYDSDIFAEQVLFYKKFTNARVDSFLQIHPDKSHMLHYKDAEKIIFSVKSLVKKN